MKHEAKPDHDSFDVKLPKSIYSDYVISVFSYIKVTIEFVFMNCLHYLIDNDIERSTIVLLRSSILLTE